MSSPILRDRPSFSLESRISEGSNFVARIGHIDRKPARADYAPPGRRGCKSHTGNVHGEVGHRMIVGASGECVPRQASPRPVGTTHR